MKLYSKSNNYELYHGSMLDMLEVIEPNSIDSIITDPPYELNFMGKGWDNSGIAFQKETWEKCYQVLKSGGYLLAFGGSRTFHRIACAIEDAGFEIRDTIMWLYGSGFPKSMNIGLAIDKKNGVDNRTGNIKKDGKATNSGSGCYNCNNGKDNSMKQEYEERVAQNEWKGWGSALKPSFEPIIVARKPFKTSLLDNVMQYGVGALNIDECRIPFNNDNWGTQKSGSTSKAFNLNDQQREAGTGILAGYDSTANENGRFPANTILTYDKDDYEEVCSGFPNLYDEDCESRYFYCAKATKKDRDDGCGYLNDGLLRRMRPDKDDDNPTGLNKEGIFAPVIRKNTHPTVKPTELMQYLVRLVNPNGATILDCFNGSGSTGKAVMYENRQRNKNYKYIGIELTEEYLPISKARIEYAMTNDIDEDEKESQGVDRNQMTIFDFTE